jgi:hypothetical protein
MFAKAQAIYRSMDHTEGLVLCGINLAETAIAIGSFDRAERQISAAEALAQRGGNGRYRNRLALLSATVLQGRNEAERALARLAPLLPAFGEDDLAKGGAPADEVLAAMVLRTRIAFEQGNREEAVWTRRLERALARSGTEQPLLRARLLRFQGQLAARRGDRAAAHRSLEEALTAYRARANRPGTAATLGELAQLAVEERDWSRAEEYLSRALFIQLWILDAPGAGNSLQVLAKVHDASGQAQNASVASRWATVAREREVNWKALRDQLTLLN